MSLSQTKPFDWGNLGRRVVSATVMIPAALACVWFGDSFSGAPYLLLISAAVVLLAMEWGRMTAPTAPIRVAIAVALAILGAALLAHFHFTEYAWLGLAVGGLAAGVVARNVSERPENAAFGVLYLGIAAVCLIWLRAMPQGVWWTIMVFLITWGADIAAFAVGNIVKGPKLWPRFSPNKTWSGFFGGLVAAALIGAFLTRTAAFELNLAAGALIGLLGGLATMAGDLCESVLKRRFGVKDSGDLIPGHGGLLDRVDGLLFAVVIIAIARLVNHLGWGH